MTTIRSAVHIHSKWSYDGSWELDALAEAFSNRGYGAVLMTEHDRGFNEDRWQEYRQECARASTADVLLVPGIEYSDADNRVHVLVWGEEISFLGEGRPTIETLEAVTELGAVAVLAHPWRAQAWTRCDAQWASHLTGIELWNRKTDGFAPSPQGLQLLDQFGLWPVASLDFHRSRQFFPLAMDLELTAPRTPEAIIDCLRRRAGSATALGGPAERFRGGLPGTLARVAETARRTIAPAVRLVLGRG